MGLFWQRKQAIMAFGKDRSSILLKEDLLNPNRFSIIPGYCGHTPQLRYTCGHTYGFHTSQLSEKFENAEKNYHKKLLHSKENLEGLPEETSCLPTKQLITGYTGYIPQHKLKYGQTFKRTTDDAISEFKRRDFLQRQAQKELQEAVKDFEKLVVKEDYPKPESTHPGYRARFYFSKTGRKFDDKMSIKEFPISGYKGYIPKNEKHMLGCTYSRWVKNAYEDLSVSKNSLRMLHKKDQHTKVTFSEIPSDSLQLSGEHAFGSIYNKTLGMIPHYTGHVPQQRFICGSTYNDSTRQILSESVKC